ncbi:hypothetical protein KC364_g14 [Hortaea werneckii]|nr:hypothetical protein KC364_g14 [Hortaea werneckii]
MKRTAARMERPIAAPIARMLMRLRRTSDSSILLCCGISLVWGGQDITDWKFSVDESPYDGAIDIEGFVFRVKCSEEPPSVVRSFQPRSALAAGRRLFAIYRNIHAFHYKFVNAS